MFKKDDSAYPERKYFERGLLLLKENNDRILFPQDAIFMDSYTRVRFLPNGRIDLYTVDEVTRATIGILVTGLINNYNDGKK